VTVRHVHRWSIVSTEEGDAWAFCPCGHQRLLTGTILRGRTAADDYWHTPEQWNRRRRADEDAHERGLDGGP